MQAVVFQSPKRQRGVSLGGPQAIETRSLALGARISCRALTRADKIEKGASVMFGQIGDIAGLLKSAKDMQANMAKMQETLLASRYEADAGGGMVRAGVNGKGGIVDIKVDPSAVQDVEMLEDLIKAAVNAAVSKAQEAMKGELTKLTGGVNIPGLNDMLGGN